MLVMLLQSVAVGAAIPSAPAAVSAANETQGVLPREVPVEGYVGSTVCASCHAPQAASWLQSDHRLAMQKADSRSVVADFGASAPGTGQTPVTDKRRFGFNDRVTSVASASGHTAQGGPEPAVDENVVGVTNRAEFTFGHDPLQMFLVNTGAGRLQAHNLAWDARPVGEGGQRWFELQPGVVEPTDVLHWQGPAQNWNHMCADCHSTAVRKNYDPASQSFETTFAEVSVGCEACHGPGARHAGSAGQEPLSGPVSIDTCATCHSRRSQLAEGFRPGDELLDHYLPALLMPGLYFADGQIEDEVYVWGSFVQSRMHMRGVTCTNCHDAHTGELRFAGDAVCTQCHNPAGRVDFPTLTRASYDTPGHHFHKPESDGARCVSCHMPARTYMQIDDRRDHSLRIPRPDLSEQTGAPDACGGCHEAGSNWAAEVLQARNVRRGPHYGEALAAGRRGEAAGESMLVRLATDTESPPLVRATALAMLARYDSAESNRALKVALTDVLPIVRFGALQGGQRWQPAQRWYNTSALLSDKVFAVRAEAARQLAPLVTEFGDNAPATLRQAVEEYQASLLLAVDRAEGQTNLANLHLVLGKTNEAEEALRIALQINPEWVPALANLADIYRATGRDVDGGILLERARKLVPEDADVAMARGLWLVRQNRQADALAEFAAAVSLAPQSVYPAYIYAVALHDAGRSEQALSVLEGALARRPVDVQLLEAAFSIARDVGETAKARAYYDRLQQGGGPQSR